MRLIDADALARQFDEGQNEYESGEDEPVARVNIFYTGDEVRARIDAAPAVSCEACKHHDAEAGTHRWQRCAGCYCASNFQRRQP